MELPSSKHQCGNKLLHWCTFSLRMYSFQPCFTYRWEYLLVCCFAWIIMPDKLGMISLACTTYVKLLQIKHNLSNTVEHAKFTTWNFHEFEVPGIFATCNFHVVRTNTFRRPCQSFLLEDCLSDGKVMMVWNLVSWKLIQDKN